MADAFDAVSDAHAERGTSPQATARPAAPIAATGATTWLRVPEAGDYSKRSKSMIIKALQDGSLRGSQTKRGGTWLIHREDLDAWIRGEQATSEPALVTRSQRAHM